MLLEAEFPFFCGCLIQIIAGFLCIVTDLTLSCRISWISGIGERGALNCWSREKRAAIFKSFGPKCQRICIFPSDWLLHLNLNPGFYILLLQKLQFASDAVFFLQKHMALGIVDENNCDAVQSNTSAFSSLFLCNFVSLIQCSTFFYAITIFNFCLGGTMRKFNQWSEYYFHRLYLCTTAFCSTACPAYQLTHK